MKIYLFRDPPHDAEYLQFMRHTTRRSIKAMRIIAVLALVASSILLGLSAFIPFDFLVDNYLEFRVLYTIMFVNTLLFLILLRWTRQINVKRRYLPVRVVLMGYSMAIIGHFMGVSLLAQYNPSNTLTFLLTGCFTIAVLVVFTLRELWLIVTLTFLTFVISLQFFQDDKQILYQNYVTGFMIVLMMFVIARLWFSYQYDYHRKIITIENKNKQISIINAQQTEMLSIVAHDLRSPLNNIAASIELLKLGGAGDPQVFYDMMEKSCRDADYFIHDLLEVARSQPGPLKTEFTKINEMLTETMQFWMRQLSDKNFSMILPDFDIEAQVHVQKLQRVLNNLIHNATKFTPAGGSIKLMLNANDEMVHIAVADTGIGIPDHLKAGLFDRFTKAGRPGLNHEQSYGLGLSICKEIVGQHGGKINIETQEGKGTTFHILLPKATQALTESA